MIEILNNAVNIFIEKCINGITVNKEKTAELLNSSLALVTALVPYLGYDKAAQLAQEAEKENIKIKELVMKKELFTEAELNKILSVEKLTRPAINFN